MQNIRPFLRASTTARVLTLAMALTLGCAGAGLAAAQGQPATPKPLVVIRFNQPHVYFDQQLYSAISQAVALKPGLMFDVVANAPATGNPSMDTQWIATASRNTQAVVASMQSMGVPLERMHVTGQTQPGLKWDETQVFVH